MRFGFMLRSAVAADRSAKLIGRLLHQSQHSVEHISSHMPLVED
jgi:hypothetical protein